MSNVKCLGIRSHKKNQSSIYQILLTQDKVADRSQRTWGTELASEISDDQWRMIILLGCKISSNSALRERHYKLQHHWYWTPERFSKMFPKAPAICWRCNRQRVTYRHCLVGLQGGYKFWDFCCWGN